MAILVLKTNIEDIHSKERLRPILDNHPAIEQWTIDTEDVDKVLRIVAKPELSYKEVIQLLNQESIDCEELCY